MTMVGGGSTKRRRAITKTGNGGKVEGGRVANNFATVSPFCLLTEHNWDGR